MESFKGMSYERLTEILEKIKSVSVIMAGDIALDVYWLADMKKSELSRETPHFPLPVTEERMSPGAGGNVAANLAALNPAKVLTVSIAGTDWRGNELIRLLENQGIDTSFILRDSSIITNAYCKPLRMGISDIVYEDPRLDFINYKSLNKSLEEIFITSLNKAASQGDVLCVSDQMPYGVITENVREHIMKLAKDGMTVIVDSRDRIGLYSGVILKPNEVEGARAVSMDCEKDIEVFAEAALALSRFNRSEVVMTIGDRGSLYADEDNVIHIEANRIDGEIDIVGAGDSFLSGFSLASAAGASRAEAAFFAGLCSEVTITQIGVTGVASPEDIIKRYKAI